MGKKKQNPHPIRYQRVSVNCKQGEKSFSSSLVLLVSIIHVAHPQKIVQPPWMFPLQCLPSYCPTKQWPGLLTGGESSPVSFKIFCCRHLLSQSLTLIFFVRCVTVWNRECIWCQRYYVTEKQPNPFLHQSSVSLYLVVWSCKGRY